MKILLQILLGSQRVICFGGLPVRWRIWPAAGKAAAGFRSRFHRQA